MDWALSTMTRVSTGNGAVVIKADGMSDTFPSSRVLRFDKGPLNSEVIGRGVDLVARISRVDYANTREPMQLFGGSHRTSWVQAPDGEWWSGSTFGLRKERRSFELTTVSSNF